MLYNCTQMGTVGVKGLNIQLNYQLGKSYKNIQIGIALSHTIACT